MPTRRRNASHVDARSKDILVVQQEPAPDAAAGDQVIHAVDRAKERALAAAAGSDDRGDTPGRNLKRHFLDGFVFAIEHGKRLGVDVCPLGLGRGRALIPDDRFSHRKMDGVVAHALNFLDTLARITIAATFNSNTSMTSVRTMPYWTWRISSTASCSVQRL